MPTYQYAPYNSSRNNVRSHHDRRAASQSSNHWYAPHFPPSTNANARTHSGNNLQGNKGYAIR
ncbi:hypothetical protein K440DRAFT_613358 [Wilcoxina mikolae CBS 423.85]|nr:hypothetical protein K440DRAFT_613358 [Wilcoxina mikolae CBS 423.85]